MFHIQFRVVKHRKRRSLPQSSDSVWSKTPLFPYDEGRKRVNLKWNCTWLTTWWGQRLGQRQRRTNSKVNVRVYLGQICLLYANTRQACLIATQCNTQQHTIAHCNTRQAHLASSTIYTYIYILFLQDKHLGSRHISSLKITTRHFEINDAVIHV
jgi:hypothetical protein